MAVWNSMRLLQELLRSVEFYATTGTLYAVWNSMRLLEELLLSVEFYASTSGLLRSGEFSATTAASSMLLVIHPPNGQILSWQQ